MLNVPRLDDLGYDRIYNRARSLIPTLTKEWTDFNDHDPGITMLQTFSWLVDTLNYYIDATGEIHMQKYLKLLGITSEDDMAARTNLSLTSGENIYIPKGAKIYAETKPYEVDDTYKSEVNTVTTILNQIGDSFYDITDFASMDKSNASYLNYVQIFSYKSQLSLALHLGFSNVIKGGIKLYVEVDDSIKRNNFDNDFSLSKLSWEYQADSKWKKATLIDDETCGFLKSGFITIEIDGQTSLSNDESIPKCHYLRCSVVENEYDILPKIGAVSVNNISVTQTDTLAETLFLTYDGSSEMVIDYYIRENSLITVLMETPKGYRAIYQYTYNEDAYCDIIDGEYSWQKIISFDHSKLISEGAKLVVIITDAQIFYKINLGLTTGYANEGFDFDIDNLYDMQVALLKYDEEDKATYYEFYDKVDNISQYSYDEKVFWYDNAKRQVVFGNSINGIQPEQGYSIIVNKIKTSLLQKGNVLKGEINRFEDENFLVLASNLVNVTTGKQKQSVGELETQIGEKLNKVSRAVADEDYKEIVLNTPGLMIDSVSVITSSEFSEAYGVDYSPNTVYVAAKPYSNEKCPKLSNKYKKNIAQNLEKYRLLTTQVKVISPQYVGIGVYGRVVLHENTLENQEAVKTILRDVIDNNVRFGENVVYGKIFSVLEMSAEVSRVAELSFERMGNGGYKNDHGDIVIYADGLTYIKEINIEFVG